MKHVFAGCDITWQRFLPDGTTLGICDNKSKPMYFKTDRKDPEEKIVEITKAEFFKLDEMPKPHQGAYAGAN
jgi:hypothetical protein